MLMKLYQNNEKIGNGYNYKSYNRNNKAMIINYIENCYLITEWIIHMVNNIFSNPSNNTIHNPLNNLMDNLINNIIFKLKNNKFSYVLYNAISNTNCFIAHNMDNNSNDYVFCNISNLHDNLIKFNNIKSNHQYKKLCFDSRNMNEDFNNNIIILVNGYSVIHLNHCIVIYDDDLSKVTINDDFDQSKKCFVLLLLLSNFDISKVSKFDNNSKNNNNVYNKSNSYNIDTNEKINNNHNYNNNTNNKINNINNVKNNNNNYNRNYTNDNYSISNDRNYVNYNNNINDNCALKRPLNFDISLPISKICDNNGRRDFQCPFNLFLHEISSIIQNNCVFLDKYKNCKSGEYIIKKASKIWKNMDWRIRNIFIYKYKLLELAKKKEANLI